MLKKIVLYFLLLFGLLVRLYKINSPLADWHSWRQADTAAVARNFVKEGIDLLHPRFDDLSNVASGKDNPFGWRFVEFPLYNAFHAILFEFFGWFKKDLISFEGAGRLVTIFSSLIGGIFLYLITKKILNDWIALIAFGFFMFLPFNIFYSRVILPEPTMIMFGLGSIYFLLKWKEVDSEDKKKIFYFLISLFMSILAILTKPYILFLLLPSWLVIFGKKYFPFLIIYASLSLLPFGLWRIWMQKFPEGIPANQWLFNLEGIRFKPAWWRWLFAERLGKLILGYWGTVFLGLGIIWRFKKFTKEILFYSWLMGIFTYFSVFARGNIQHDYYQIVILPVVAVFLAKGFYFLISNYSKNFYWILSWGLAIVFLIFSLGFSWYEIRGFYQINHPEIIEVGKKANEILPPNARVIAPYNGDTAFLYQINRKGWPIVSESISNLIKKGATHYVAVNFDEVTLSLIETCPVLEKDSNWVIIDLINCPSLK
ncbi:MAG: phospholipid carrier-dependent glycosyltransferase [Microgenomates group bacterium]